MPLPIQHLFCQVSVTALEPGTLLTWHRDRVKFCLMEDAKLQAIFDHVVGRDVVRKLMQVIIKILGFSGLLSRNISNDGRWTKNGSAAKRLI